MMASPFGVTGRLACCNIVFPMGTALHYSQ